MDEIKTHLAARAVPIRSKTPAGVVQEIYGLMLAHSVVRRVMHDAAAVAIRDPDRLSFLDSLRVLQCQLPESPQLDTETWYRRLLREVWRQELRPRRDRCMLASSSERGRIGGRSGPSTAIRRSRRNPFGRQWFCLSSGRWG